MNWFIFFSPPSAQWGSRQRLSSAAAGGGWRCSGPGGFSSSASIPARRWSSFSLQQFHAGGCTWLVGQAGWEQPTPAVSPALSSLHTFSNPGKAASGSRAGRLSVNSQSKNSRRVLASGTGEIIQTSPNGLRFIYLLVVFFNPPAGS